MKVEEFKIKGIKALVEPLIEDMEVRKGIIVSNTKKDKPACKARIIKSTIKDIENGDLVLINEYSGITLDFDGKKLLLVNPYEILGKFNQ